MFDERSEKWFPAGPEEFHVTALGSHQSYLYAATDDPGAIYRASIPTVQPYAKAATTWGAIKRKMKKREKIHSPLIFLLACALLGAGIMLIGTIVGTTIRVSSLRPIIQRIKKGENK